MNKIKDAEIEIHRELAGFMVGEEEADMRRKGMMKGGWQGIREGRSNKCST